MLPARAAMTPAYVSAVIRGTIMLQMATTRSARPVLQVAPLAAHLATAAPAAWDTDKTELRARLARPTATPATLPAAPLATA